MPYRIATTVAALALGQAAAAEDWSVLVIGNDGDAFVVADELAGSGVRDVRHLPEGGPRDIADAVLGLAGAERALVYYNGPLTQRAGQPAIGDDPRLTMAAVADTLFSGGATQAALLVENCGGRGTGAAIAPPVGSLRGDFLLAASAGPDGACAGPALTQALLTGGVTTPLQNIAQAGWVGVPGSAVMSLDPGGDVTVSEVVFLEPRPEGQLVGAAPEPTTTQTALFIAPPTAQLVSIPIPAGYPEPSIIVGLIEPVTPTAPEVSVAAVAAPSLALSYDNLEARVAFRESDEEGFLSLVSAGALDPPSAELAVAIQTELARMECYTSTIDGIFGRGSQAAVGRYYDERGVPRPASLDASVDIFRDIISNDDVECPRPVVQQPTPRATSSSSSSSSTTRTTRPAPAAPRAAPAPAPSTGGGRTITGGSAGIGVFR